MTKIVLTNMVGADRPGRRSWDRRRLGAFTGADLRAPTSPEPT